MEDFSKLLVTSLATWHTFKISCTDAQEPVPEAQVLLVGDNGDDDDDAIVSRFGAAELKME